MSREYRENQYRVMELFARDDQPEAVCCEPQKTTPATPQSGHGKTMLSEDLWAGTRRRHCESREHLRHLLDKHLKPHGH